MFSRKGCGLPETNIRFVLQLSTLGFFHGQALESVQEQILIKKPDLCNTFQVCHTFMSGFGSLSTEQRRHYNFFLYLFLVI